MLPEMLKSLLSAPRRSAAVTSVACSVLIGWAIASVCFYSYRFLYTCIV